MDVMKVRDGTEYFGTAHGIPKDPEFTVRNINTLLDHAEPIPNNFYSFIRGRDIFDRVESYRSFLNDVRLIVQPDGVVEFIEVDPRPRVHAERRPSSTRDRKNGPMLDWGDSIADRFKNPTDDQLETGYPEWNQRVEERIKASMRPRDGNSGEELKGRLQGCGFWDVKEIVLRIPIGGETEAGQLLLKEMIRQVELENQIPLVRPMGFSADMITTDQTSSLQKNSRRSTLKLSLTRNPFSSIVILLQPGSRRLLGQVIFCLMVRDKR